MINIIKSKRDLLALFLYHIDRQKLTYTIYVLDRSIHYHRNVYPNKNTPRVITAFKKQRLNNWMCNWSVPMFLQVATNTCTIIGWPNTAFHLWTLPFWFIALFNFQIYLLHISIFILCLYHSWFKALECVYRTCVDASNIMPTWIYFSRPNTYFQS